MDYIMLYPSLGILVALLVIPMLPPRLKGLAALVIVTLNCLITGIAAIEAFRQPVVFAINTAWIPGEIRFSVDALSSWFILMINLTCFTGAWYGRHYMNTYLDQKNNLSLHWILFTFFHYSMILVVSAYNGFAFLVVWEVMSISSFLLVLFDHSRITTIRAGLNYLVQAHIGTMFLTVAFIWVWVAADSMDFSALTVIPVKNHAPWIFLLFVLGFGVKAGFIPFHSWLPHAHPAAPSHVSGIMSGVMVSMGIYGILRVSSFLTTHLLTFGLIVFFLSLFTACYGIFNAAIHRDYKRVLAFSTIENMGIAGIGIGMGLLGKYSGNSIMVFLGFSGALMHVLNHSLYKPLLFFASGTLYHLAGTRNMEQLGGLVRKLPFTAFAFLCGAIAITGLPPFNGFISKFMLFSGMIEGINLKNSNFSVLMITGMTGLALVGGLSLLTFTKAFSVIFLGVPRKPSRYQRPEYFNSGHFPLILIIFLMLVIALSPSVVLQPLEHIALIFDASQRPAGFSISVYDVLSKVGRASLLLILLSGALYTIRSIVTRKRTTAIEPTWSCAYTAPNSRMQYTGKSFSKSLTKLVAFLAGERKRYTEIPPDSVFPSSKTYRSSYAEFFEKHFINKLSNMVIASMNAFSFVHNGRIQYYILYGLIFILLLIAATAMSIL